MDNLPPSDGRSNDSGTVEMGKRKREEINPGNQVKKRQNLELEDKNILKQWKKVKKSVAEKVAHSRAESCRLKTEMDKMVAAADEKQREVKFEKEKRDGVLAAMQLMLGTEHVLMQALFPPSGNC